MIEEISPLDLMWEKDAKEYFEIAEAGLECVRRGLHAAESELAHRILDFGCGHGRVMRALRVGFPDAQLTACDLDEDGVRFCVERFGAHGVVSTADITRISLPDTYEVIWCGSVLTHLDVPQWKQLLGRFAGWLEPGGVLVFTTHGPRTAATLRAGRWSYGLADHEIEVLLSRYDGAAGFGYVEYPGQTGYGFSISDPALVQEFLGAFEDLVLLAFEDGGWYRYQDAFSCMRTAGRAGVRKSGRA